MDEKRLTSTSIRVGIERHYPSIRSNVKWMPRPSAFIINRMDFLFAHALTTPLCCTEQALQSSFFVLA